jgi:hypothetical protein
MKIFSKVLEIEASFNQVCELNNCCVKLKDNIFVSYLGFNNTFVFT